MTYSDTSVVVPTLNEEKNITELIGLISKFGGIRIIVADDGSKVRTQAIAKGKKGVKLIDRSRE